TIRSPWILGSVRSAQIPNPWASRSEWAIPPTAESVIGSSRRWASSRTTSPIRTIVKPRSRATTRISSLPHPGIPVTQTTRTGCEETEGSLKRFPPPLSLPSGAAHLELGESFTNLTTQSRNFVGHPQRASSWLLPAFCFSEASRAWDEPLEMDQQRSGGRGGSW